MLPTNRVPVQLDAGQRLTSRNAPSPSVWGLASLNASEQCFILWSRREKDVATRVTLLLRERPAHAQNIELYTLGPKHADFKFLQSVALPPPPETTVVFSLTFSRYDVVQACIGRGAGTGTQMSAHTGGTADGEPQSLLPSTLYARHDVLVPRGPDAAQAPAGMGHYDTWHRTLTVAIAADEAPGERVGLAGVVLRGVSTRTSLSLALTLHRAITTHATSANGTIDAAVRVDYLNASSLPVGSFQLQTAGANTSELWSGSARAYPLASERVEHDALPSFDDNGRALVLLQLGARAPLEWTTADDGARRVRVSLLLRASAAPSRPPAARSGVLPLAGRVCEAVTLSAVATTKP